MYSSLNAGSSRLDAGYPSLNDLLVRARWAELSGSSGRQGRTRSSLRINLDVRRARQENPSR
jgi:hypothetical protein